MSKKIGLFGGTFNPFHFGHINLALELKEKQQLDAIWFIPALQSPLRTQEPLVDARHRLKMLELGISTISGFEICDIELQRPPPSYTIDTIKELQSYYPKYNFYLSLGEDSIQRFKEWKDLEEIVRLIPLLIGSRQIHVSEDLASLNFSEQILAAIHKGLVVTRQMEISATQIRERLEKKLYCGHLLPGKILDYIYENQLYFTPQLT